MTYCPQAEKRDQRMVHALRPTPVYSHRISEPLDIYAAAKVCFAGFTFFAGLVSIVILIGAWAQ